MRVSEAEAKNKLYMLEKLCKKGIPSFLKGVSNKLHAERVTARVNIDYECKLR